MRERRSKVCIEDKAIVITSGEDHRAEIIRIESLEEEATCLAFIVRGSFGRLEWTMYETMPCPCRVQAIPEGAKEEYKNRLQNSRLFQGPAERKNNTRFTPGSFNARTHIRPKVRTYLSKAAYPPFPSLFSLRHRRRRYHRRRSCQVSFRADISDHWSARLSHFLGHLNHHSPLQAFFLPSSSPSFIRPYLLLHSFLTAARCFDLRCVRNACYSIL